MKPKRFFFHYNKPASQKAGAPRISVHFDGECHIVEGISVLVATASKISDKQPRCVMQGWAQEVTIFNGVAIVT